MKTLYLNHNEFFEFCKGYDENKTIKSPFNFLRLPTAPPAVFLKGRKFLVLRGAEDKRRQEECVRCTHGVCRSKDGATPRRGLVDITTSFARTTEFQATTRSARANDQSLRDCCSKKVRAKVTMSPQIETSCFVRSLRDRTGRGKAERIWCRFATNWDGEEKEKRAVLSLVSYLKTI